MLVVALVTASLAAAGLGLALRRARQRHERALGERGWLLERERETAARAAVGEERARIARELHDIVSHNVSVMIVQAGAAREVLATMPDEAGAALAAVERAGRDTMTELRHLLGLLAPAADGDDDDDEGTVFAPQPTLTRLGPLVDRIAFAGLPVEVRIAGEPRPLPTGIDVTAFRIVQEALTNALKHGSGGKAEVTIRYAGHSLRVEILTTGPSVLTAGHPRRPSRPTRPATLSPGPGRLSAGAGREERSGTTDGAGRPGGADGREERGTGRGLAGLRERVALYGGDLDARRRLGGGYRVRARLPLDAR
ncbi:sensor histidine kinase [Actinoplanes utahensis]|uniref:histidine kinase n=1 Tax=Actinoplanes utahensis TaxID=1869 RepID=A0A0A6X9W4_ACTUT|nr:histidine kinase [Actinoplanes utahensis]KHD76882.1 histidine kinase [Actinoplanes utahensis]GIF27371.1 hypothetical protein Aut01nite_03570 [Actinoplanes utahensis]